MSTTIKYLVRAKIIEGRAAPHSSQLESALDVGIEGAPEDTGLDAIETFEVVDVTHAGTSAGAQPGALARLFELHDETPSVLTAEDWAAARAEFSRYSIALRTIAQMWDGETVPEPETYDDTESAYNNGHDVASYEAAKLAREAISAVKSYPRGEESGGPIAEDAHAFDRELLELERRKLVELRGGSVTLTREGYLAIAQRHRRRR